MYPARIYVRVAQHLGKYFCVTLEIRNRWRLATLRSDNTGVAVTTFNVADTKRYVTDSDHCCLAHCGHVTQPMPYCE
jgi:hypothetical protein